MNDIPERNYKDEGARVTYNLYKGTVEMLRKQGRESEIASYLEGKIEATDRMEHEARVRIQSMISDYRKRKFLGMGK